MTRQVSIFICALGLAMTSLPTYAGHKLQQDFAATDEENLHILPNFKKRIAENPVIVDITMSKAGELASAIGDKLMKMDSLIVRGAIDKTDFRTMWEAGIKGKLKGINLEFANPKDKAIPDTAFYHIKEQSFSDGLLPLYIDYITLPADLEKIGESAFRCVAIKELNLPPTLKSIGSEAFAHCGWIETYCLEIPEGVEKIPYCCFRQCYGIQSYALPSTIRELEPLAFFDSYMKSIYLPEGLQKIGAEAFFMCEELTELTIPETCLEIGEHAFGSCYSLKAIQLPDAMESLPQRLLENSYSLPEITFPKELKEIGDEAFKDCTGLKKITLPEGLEYIQVDAFLNCSNIKEAYLPSTLKAIQAGAAAGWTNLEKIYCAAAIPPQALGTNGDPEMTPFGFYSTSSHSTPRDTPLYVPERSAERYRMQSGWWYFTNIRETDDFPTSVKIATDDVISQKDSVIYDLNGHPTTNPSPGKIYIQNTKKTIFH